MSLGTVDFVVHGTPKSSQAKSSKSKSRWKASVKAAIPVGVELLDGPVLLRIDYFFAGETDLDTDNIIKPIQDALNEEFYADDKTVVDVCSRKVNLEAMPSMRAVPPSLMRTLADGAGQDFVLIRVSPARSRLDFQ